MVVVGVFDFVEEEGSMEVTVESIIVDLFARDAGVALGRGEFGTAREREKGEYQQSQNSERWK